MADSSAVNAISTENTFLMHSTDGSTYKKLVDIKEFPDLGAAPGTIDVTTLSDHQKMYLNDLLDTGALEFNCNYVKADYEALQAIAGKKGEQFAIWFGIDATGEPSGDYGKFTFKGELAVWVKGGGTSASVDMGISIAPSTAVEMAE